MMAEQETQTNGDLASFSELLQCVICFEPYTNPKMLQCGHSFCEECLQGYHKVNQQAHNAQPGKLPCPTCRELTSIPENGIKGLRNDFKAHKLEKVLRMMAIRNRASSCLCDPCTSEKISVDASVYCSKCKVNYCNGCLLIHNKNMIFKDHTVFEKSVHENLATELTCKVHKGENGRYFCQTCKAVVCVLCIIKEHSEHSVVETNEFCMQRQQQQDMHNLQQIIDSKVVRQQIAKATLEAQRTQILSSREKAQVGLTEKLTAHERMLALQKERKQVIEHAIKEKASQMTATIQKLETELLRDLRQNSVQKLEPLEKELEMVDFYITKAHSLQEYMRSSGKDNLIQMMTVHDELIQRMHTIAEADESTHCYEHSLDLTFLAAEQDLTIGHVIAVGRCRVSPDKEDLQAATAVPAAPRYVVLVSGFKDTDEDALKEFFQSRRHSGGGPVDNIDFRKDTGEAVVTFLNEADAAKLMSLDSLELEGARLSVTPLSDSHDGLDRDSCRPRTIKVEGICKDTPIEIVELFFENRRSSGGGDIELIEYDGGNIAFIIFKDADSASRVVQKEAFIVNNKRLQVKLMTPPQYMPFVQGPFEENLVLVSGLPLRCTGAELETFFSAPNIHIGIQQVTFSLTPGVAMLQFTHNSEFLRLRELCVTKPFRGTMLTLQRVPQSRSIQVHSIGNITEEIIMLYFESKRRSGGGEVANIHFCQGEEYALLEFVECATARCILAKDNHTILNRLLHVTIYYECLGLMFPNYKTKPDSWTLMSVRVRGLNECVLKFLQGSAESRQLVNTDMASVSAVVEWRTHAWGTITLTSTVRDIAKDPRRLYTTWSQTASDTFKQLLATNFTSQQLETLHSVY